MMDRVELWTPGNWQAWSEKSDEDDDLDFSKVSYSAPRDKK